MLLRMMIVLTMLSGSWLSAPPSASADTPLGTIAAGNGPFSAAVNPITNRIYIANEQDSSVTVIDGATNARTTVATLSHPTAIAVNAVTNRIYVAHPDHDKVSVIDGAGSNVTEIIDAGDGPTDIAVNAATNKIYVANRAGDDVTVIDGVDHTTETVAAGDEPYRISVNAVTNKIYVVNTASHNVIVIDGADHSTQTVTVGSLPNAVAVNPITNKIYVTNQGDNSVTVINGADNSTEPPVAVEDSPVHIAVNPVTNKIYAANQGDNSVTVIDGTDNSTERVAAGNGPQFVTVNSVTNKIYVANSLGSDITVVDGASNTPRTIATGDGPFVVVVNAVTNTIYAANRNDDSVTVIDGADNLTETVSRGDRPTVIAVNTLTNRIYVTNFFASTVSVLDGAGNLIETVAAGSSYALAVNEVTNKIYVANYYDQTVTVIDGVDHSTEIIDVGDASYSVAVNPITNKIYVANLSSGSVSVIDGATNEVENVATGDTPFFVAVNPITNKIYVANSSSNTVTVIDGADNTTRTVAAGDAPYEIAINSVTNKIYVANWNSGSVTVIDGADLTTDSVAVGDNAGHLAVNSVTNKIYVSAESSDTVTVIDGADNSTTTLAAGNGPRRIAINPATNKIYVINAFSNNVTVIDGNSNTTETIDVGSAPGDIAVNAGTNRIYVPNQFDDTVSIIDGAGRVPNPLQVDIVPLPGHMASGTNAAFTFRLTNAYHPNPTKVLDVYYQLDGTLGQWNRADAFGEDWVATVSSATYGRHVLYALALEAQGDGVTAGIASAYTFNLLPENTISPAAASFDKYAEAAAHADITTTLTLYGYPLASIASDAATLVRDTDYSVTGSTVTIKKEFLAAQPTGTVNLTFTFGSGTTLMLPVTVTDSTPPSGGIDLTAPVISLTASPTSPTYGNVTVTAAVYETGSGMDSLKWAGGARLASYFAGEGTIFAGSFDVSANGTYTVYARDVAGNEAVETIEITNIRIPTTPSGPSPVDQAEPEKDTEPKTEIFIDKGIIVIKVAPRDVKEVKREDGRTVDQVVLPQDVADKLPKLLESVERPLVRVVIHDRKPDMNLQLPADLLDEAMSIRSDVAFEARLNGSSFQLEVNVLDLKQLAAKLGVDVREMKVNILIRTLTGAEREELAAAARKQSMTLLSEAIEFRLLVTGGGRTVEVSDFGGSYMMKSIVLDAGAAQRNYTAVLYDPSAQSFAFVPAVTANRDDGGSESVMRMPHNSIYAVMESPLISFADMQGHWAKPSVEQMATKRIVNGVSNTAYAPDRAITRAEFTALLVRALGIRTEADAAGNAFEDVAASAWYAAAVEAGLRSGLVSGIGGTRFAPEERITREQMAVMLANARALATERAAGAGQTANLPSGFSDAAEVSPWARAAVAEAVAAGIIQGMTPDRLAPAASATRAQAAVMLKRLMEDIGFLEKVSD
ncbi:YVTN family beta-propeller protein [Cohnella sp. SGD-V74]|uniref:S-layer homology domain-containing protein n=1 Tax=unclassified Cohnella TaxID=2636738 RepID=UPI000D40B13F|nr:MULTISPECIES: S-layer homology domain-containing protein [unclassified Cohnella]PRX69845.1 YVTN family beta-propeller protein [Cohnella sp. SGD-V74]